MFYLLCIGTLTSVFSTIVAMSKKMKPNVVTFQEEDEDKEEAEEEEEKVPLTKRESSVAPEKP